MIGRYKSLPTLCIALAKMPLERALAALRLHIKRYKLTLQIHLSESEFGLWWGGKIIAQIDDRNGRFNCSFV